MAIRAGLRVGLALSVYLTDVDAEAVFAMARATGLTAYDASYLHLAQDLGSPLATFDGPLSQAARQLGLLR
jgi:predicted nucleic acid-binding protein